MSKAVTLSLPQTRRLAIASQGFGPRPAKPSVGHLPKLAARLHAFQIDSVNVLARAHYVPAFVLGDTLVARCDLKADRQHKVLMVQGAFLEPGQDARRAAPELAAELRQVQEWLGLHRIEVAERGDLAARLRRSLRQPTAR